MNSNWFKLVMKMTTGYGWFMGYIVILTKNEEKNLRKCVESFRGVAKRFVIVDSFSTDGTEALCKELNVELQKIGSGLDFYQNKWISYANQLNWGLQNTGIDTEWSMRNHRI